MAKTTEKKPVEIVKASISDLRMAPRKVALVASLVRGRTVEDALTILSNTPRRAAEPLVKAIESARANATNNHDFKEVGLVIETISVSAGTRWKRYRPISRGRAHPYIKRNSNVYIELTGEKKPAKEKVSTKTTVRKASDKKGAK
ncbi:50S ribosomal protein L22 [Candidatus Saccharibacteria bacterium]|nr:50S ribosomal protein L22 [Candidatus Saccharibacteria bacterium]